MRTKNPEKPWSRGRHPGAHAPRPPLAVVVSLAMALVLFLVGAALLALPRSQGLTAVAAMVAATASLWLLILAFRAVRAETSARSAPPPARVVQPRRSMPSTPAPGGRAALELALNLERQAAVERARRLTESSFLAGSNAVVNARAVLRGLEDCKERLNESSHRLETAGRDESAVSIARAFESVLADLEQLAACARQLRPLAESAAMGAARASSAGDPSRFGPRSEFHPPQSTLFAAALKLGELAAELEHGLLGVSSEVRVLRRAGLTRPSLNGKPGQRRSASDASWGRTLERLEAQVFELAEQVAGFTRDAEQLSRVLGQLP